MAWAYLGSLLIEFAEPNERDIRLAAFISTVNLISQAFGAALAGTIANIAGFGNPVCLCSTWLCMRSSGYS